MIKNKSGHTTLSPGVYCSGIKIQHGDVLFQEGIYIIKDGPFEITSNAETKGTYVAFYFTGNNAVFNFSSNSDVNFTAPKDGEDGSG